MRSSGGATRWLLAAGLAGCVDTGLHAADGPPGEGLGPTPFPGAGVDGPVVSGPLYPDGWAEPEAEPPGPAAFLFEEGTIHRFDLELDGDARSRLSSDPKTDVEATLTYGDQSWIVGVHLKGSFSFRPLSQKASFKIDFEEFVPDQRFHGIRRLTFNNMVQDRSMIREHVAYSVYRRLGVPAPRHGYAELYVNGEPYGLYGMLETLDGTWAEHVFPKDGEGSLYEGGYGVDLEGNDAYDFDLQRQGDLLEPWTDVEALITELDNTPPGGLVELLDRRFDSRALFRMWAMDVVSGHRDGYVKRKNNFLVYHGLESDRWWMVPWGQDQTMRDGLDIHGNYSGRVAKDCAEVPECQARLDMAIGYVADVWEAWDLHGYAEATGAAIQEACERDPRREDQCGYESVLEMIAARPGEVREMLDLKDD